MPWDPWNRVGGPSITPSVTPHRRRVGALAMLVAPVLVAACGGDDGGGEGSDTPTARLAAACSQEVDDRDFEIAEGYQDASLEVLYATAGDETPTDDEIADWAEAVDAHREQLAGSVERLGEVETDDADTEAWGVVVDGGRAQLGTVEARAELLVGGDWADVDAGWTVAPGPPGGVADALEELGLVGRDCEGVFEVSGNPPEHAAFVEDAAAACSAIVDRRTANAFSEDTDIVLGAFAAVYEDEPIADPDAVEAALRAVIEEWEATTDDVDGVDTADAPDGWATVVAAATERHEIMQLRLDAVESGDDAAVAEAFDPGRYEIPGFDFAAVGLDRRDCRSVDG